MSRTGLLYILGGVYIILGLVSIVYAFKKKDWKKEMYKTNQPPPVRVYSRWYFVFLGILLLYGALRLLFGKIK
jgi:uncharacterized membrane protein HdeD (DUF308 family)